MVISTLGWVLVGVAAWLVVGVLIGRMIRQRDLQVPVSDDPLVPHERPDEQPGASRAAGRDRQRRR